jgi:hypothetical protein
MDGLICIEICPLPPMMQAIQSSPMVLNNPLEERQLIMCLDVELFVAALEHLLWICVVLLNIDVCLWSRSEEQSGKRKGIAKMNQNR